MNSQEARSTVANNIVAYRKMANMTQFDLSDISNTSRSTICNIENSTVSATVDVIVQLSMAMNIHPSFLFAKNRFEFVSKRKPKSNVVPIKAKPGDSGFFYWGAGGIEFFPITAQEMKLIISMLNSIKNDDFL